MKYFELTFVLTPNNEAAADVLAALLADVGCDTFVPTPTGLTAYILQSNYDEAAIHSVIAAARSTFPPVPEGSPLVTVPEGSPLVTAPEGSPLVTVPEGSPLVTVPEGSPLVTVPEGSPEGLTITFSLAAAPDENWNATWEAEHHFEPIALPNGTSFQIIPRQAFGSGEHATTRLMISLLSTLDVAGSTVIDAGCGTGVLSLAALKLGASRVFAYDIDEWSVSNAEDNLRLNDLSPSAALILHGDASCLSACPRVDILMANINRNILLADLPAFAAHLLPTGHLLLSGFYEADIAPLTAAAAPLGLRLQTTLADGDWRALHFIPA